MKTLIGILILAFSINTLHAKYENHTSIAYVTYSEPIYTKVKECYEIPV